MFYWGGIYIHMSFVAITSILASNNERLSVITKSDDIEFITGLKTQYAQKSAYIKKFHRQEPITLHLILSTLTHWLQRLMIKKGNP